MGSLVGLMYHIFCVKIITLLAEKRVHPDLFVPDINEVDIYRFDPSDLPALSETESDDQVWYFFIEPNYKYANSKRAHRATSGGYWKITGKGRDVKDKGEVIGSKKTLVFCRRGRTSKQTETDWVMHEFYVKDSPLYEVEPPPLSSNNLVSGSINHVSESSSLVGSQLLLSYEFEDYLRNDFIESSASMMYPQPPAEIEEISSYNWLNHNSQLPSFSYLEGSYSSNSNGISNNCNMGSYQFTGGLEDVVNSQRYIQN